MQLCRIRLNIAGDRNQLIVKEKISPAEIMVLEKIHGAGSVHDVEIMANDGRADVNTLKRRLEVVYKKTRVGSSSDKRPVLVTVFPGWPNVSLPSNLSDINLAPELLKKEPEYSAEQKAALAKAAEIEKAQKDAEAKADADAEAKETERLKAEAEAKEKADAEAAEAKAKADADARAKEEADAKAAEAEKAKASKASNKSTGKKPDDTFME